MEEELKHSLSIAESVQGRKLLWVDVDSDNDTLYLLFEGDGNLPIKVVAVDCLKEIGDSTAFVAKYLRDRLAAADRIKQLQKIATPVPEVKAPTP